MEQQLFAWIREQRKAEPAVSWNEFPVSIVRNSFIGSGYYYEDSIDCKGETESDSDVDD